MMYRRGEGVEASAAESRRFHHLAAALEVADAQFSLGETYDKDAGESANQVIACRWYRLAAEQGHVEAQYRLGVKYEQGVGVPLDKIRAWFWLEAAARNGHAVARAARDRLSTLMTPAEASEARRLAGKWVPKTADPPGLKTTTSN
jgi:TPR repeat protein